MLHGVVHRDCQLFGNISPETKYLFFGWTISLIIICCQCIKFCNLQNYLFTYKQIWRRSYDTRPPALEAGDPRSATNEAKYAVSLVFIYINSYPAGTDIE